MAGTPVRVTCSPITTVLTTPAFSSPSHHLPAYRGHLYFLPMLVKVTKNKKQENKTQDPTQRAEVRLIALGSVIPKDPDLDTKSQGKGFKNSHSSSQLVGMPRPSALLHPFSI